MPNGKKFRFGVTPALGMTVISFISGYIEDFKLLVESLIIRSKIMK